jgi:hypothetical protein
MIKGRSFSPAADYPMARQNPSGVRYAKFFLRETAYGALDRTRRAKGQTAIGRKALNICVSQNWISVGFFRI